MKAGYGRFDAESARELMTRPAAMRSNIHSVLFEPEALDFWVANADNKNVASHTRYTNYNLAELLKGPPNSPFKNTPGKGTGPTRPSQFCGIPTGRVIPRGTLEVL